MLSKAEKYAQRVATASPQYCPKPNLFRILLLDISKHLSEKDAKNFMAFVEDYGREDDKGALTAEQLQEETTMYRLLMASAKVGFIQPNNLSNLKAFLDTSDYDTLVKEIEKFQKKMQSQCIIHF